MLLLPHASGLWVNYCTDALYVQRRQRPSAQTTNTSWTEWEHPSPSVNECDVSQIHVVEPNLN